jgi:uncharacterized protein (DUF1800 family)
MLTSYSRTLSLEDAAHLVKRTSFGGSAATIRSLVGKTPQDALEQLMDFSPEQSSKNPYDPADAINKNGVTRITQARWLFEMIHGEAPMREKLAFFLHGHFAISSEKVDTHEALAQYLSVLREHSLKPFGVLTLEIAKSPAMLRYLDNDQNKKGKPNENFARELFELFTMGVGNYSEKDVQESARAFTGWTFTGPSKKAPNAKLQFVFQRKQHDDGNKTILGQQGNLTGEDVVRIAVAYPSTATFLATKLLKFYVSSNPKPEDVAALAAVWTSSRGNLKEVLTTLFTSSSFYAAKNQIVKSPLDFVIGSVRALELPIQGEKFYGSILNTLIGLGHAPLMPPNVSGWEGGRSWVSDGALLSRIQTAASFTLSKKVTLNNKDLTLALLGSETTALNPIIQKLPLQEQAYLLMISPEYALI